MFFFCMLVASGTTRQEAYAAIYRPTTNGTGTIASKAATLQKNKPGISQLIEAIQYQRSGATATKTGSPKEDAANIAESNKVDKKNFRYISEQRRNFRRTYKGAAFCDWEG